MVDKNVRNCNITKRIINLIITIIAIIIAQIIADRFLNGSFMWTLIILLAILFIMTPLGINIDSKIDKHYENKRND